MGVAGKGINAANALESYLSARGGQHSVVRKVYAPIWVDGPIQNFTSGRSVIIGDAAGQSKPTTAGGIYTCGMGGVLAGRAVVDAARKNDDRLLAKYQKNWLGMFGSEFEKMLLARKLLERLDNKASFADLARVHSEDSSAAKGGELGWLSPGDTVPEFERAMALLKPGEVSAPVQSQFGWHLIQVLERRTEDLSKERQRLIARQELRARKSDEAYQEWVRQMRDKAYVELRLEER